MPAESGVLGFATRIPPPKNGIPVKEAHPGVAEI